MRIGAFHLVDSFLVKVREAAAHLLARDRDTVAAFENGATLKQREAIGGLKCVDLAEHFAGHFAAGVMVSGRGVSLHKFIPFNSCN